LIPPATAWTSASVSWRAPLVLRETDFDFLNTFIASILCHEASKMPLLRKYYVGSKSATVI
jgi:hypothetical protein